MPSSSDRLAEIMRAAAEESRVRAAIEADRARRDRDAAESAELRAEVKLNAVRRNLTESFGTRAAYDANLARYRSALSRPGTPGLPTERIVVASAAEVARDLRQRATLDSTSGAGLVDEDVSARRVVVAPAANVASLIPVVPTETLQVRSTFVHLPTTGTSQGADEGQPYADLSGVTVDTTQLFLKPWGASATIQRDHLRDAGVAAAVFDAVMERAFYASLSTEMLTGNGTDSAGVWHLSGVTNRAGLTTVALGTGTRTNAISQAVAAVQNKDYGASGVAVVASPTTLQSILTEKDGGGQPMRPTSILPAVTAWIPTTALANGTAIVGDFRAGAALFMAGELEITLAPSHADYFTKGLVLADVSLPMVLDVTTDAFTEVTGL
jgi:HK97 family phage major capsid protein